MTDFDEEGPPTLSGAGPPDPTELGTCRIEARIAAGPGTRVFRAVDLSLGRTVVVKAMIENEEEPAATHRFLVSGDALAGLKLQNVVPVIRTGQDHGFAYTVFEHVDGEDLDRAVKRERALVPAAAARAVLDTAQGLQAALEHGVTHGDVRPRHLIRVRGTTKVTGFSQSPIFVTAQGRRLKGHPSTIAPELAVNGSADHRADIYSLGCTLFTLITGRGPFGTAGADALVACHVHERFPRLSSQGVRAPEEIEAFLAKLCARGPQGRFQTYAELLEAGAVLLPALRRLVPDEPAVVVEDGRQAGLRTLIPEGDLLLGRTPGEGVQIDDARCSRRHALIRRSGDYIEVEDLSSRNGIRVNGTEVRSKQLFPGDRIEIGDTLLRIEGAVPPVQVQPAVPASPVRGAFGDIEVAHTPQKQASADALSATGGQGAELRVRVLARLAPLLASTSVDIRKDVVSALAEALSADDSAIVRVDRGQPVFEARTSHEAQVLSCILPAIERSLPGQLSLATAVKVGRDDRWGVVMAPVLRGGAVVALVALIKTAGRFDEHALSLLESCCSLLSLRGAG